MHKTYSTSNAVIEWLLVVKMLETEIHLFHYSAIPLFLIPRFTNSQLFAITQLLCHVSALLTSACKQA